MTFPETDWALTKPMLAKKKQASKKRSFLIDLSFVLIEMNKFLTSSTLKNAARGIVKKVFPGSNLLTLFNQSDKYIHFNWIKLQLCWFWKTQINAFKARRRLDFMGQNDPIQGFKSHFNNLFDWYTDFYTILRIGRDVKGIKVLLNIFFTNKYHMTELFNLQIINLSYLQKI